MFGYLKEITDGKAKLLKEICLSPAASQCMNIVPFVSLDEARLSKEFFVDRFEALIEDEPLACDLSPGVDLQSVMIPTNINDAVKESLNNLTIQDRLLLKRSAVLGADFDIHTLMAISSGMKISDVLESVSNLISNNIFVSACTLKEMPDMTGRSIGYVNLGIQNTCFCFTVYRATNMRNKGVSKWPVGPYHRFRFRTNDFRVCMLEQMTKEQLYNMRMEVTDNLETHGPECNFCKRKRIEGIEAKSTFTSGRKCVCLSKRSKLFSDISNLYTSMGMTIFPIYFRRKAAQAANNMNFPIQALNYIQLAEKMFDQHKSTEEELPAEETFFDLLVLKVSLKKTKAESFLLLGATYSAVIYASEALELLGLNNLCFHGVFNPQEFKKILPNFKLLHAEAITKNIGILARAYLQAANYKAAQEVVRIEFIALALYPIDFLQIVNHMLMQYQCQYWLNQRVNLNELETNIFIMCNDKLKGVDTLLDLTEINAIGTSYITVMEINLLQQNFTKAENIAFEGIKSLKSVSDMYTLPKLKLLLCHIYHHSKQYGKCFEALKEVQDIVDSTHSQKLRSLYQATLAHLIMESPEDVRRVDIFSKTCSRFASKWDLNMSLSITKDKAFYVSVSLALWCQHIGLGSKKTRGKDIFKQCYDIAVSLHKNIDKTRENYWLMTAILYFYKLNVMLIAEKPDLKEDVQPIKKALKRMHLKIKKNFPLYLSMYEEVVIDAEDVG